MKTRVEITITIKHKDEVEYQDICDLIEEKINELEGVELDDFDIGQELE